MSSQISGCSQAAPAVSTSARSKHPSNPESPAGHSVKQEPSSKYWGGGGVVTSKKKINILQHTIQELLNLLASGQNTTEQDECHLTGSHHHSVKGTPAVGLPLVSVAANLIRETCMIHDVRWHISSHPSMQELILVRILGPQGA